MASSFPVSADIFSIETRQAANQIAGVATPRVVEDSPQTRTETKEELFNNAIYNDRSKISKSKKTAVATAQEAGISFFSLSAELRNIIYDYVFEPEKEFIKEIHIGRIYSTNGEACKGSKVPAICQANSQLRKEALSVFYGAIPFSYHTRSSAIEEDGLSVPLAWFNSLDINSIRLIKKFTIYVIFDNAPFDNEQLVAMLGQKVKAFQESALRITQRKFEGVRCRRIRSETPRPVRREPRRSGRIMERKLGTSPRCGSK